MNIFMFKVLDFQYNAERLDDVLLNKMIVETEQLLSTYLHIKELAVEGLYKSCYEKHPCQLWLQESIANVKWLLKQLEFYIKEWKFRFNKERKTIYNKLEPIIRTFKNENFTQWIGCFSESGCNNYEDYYNYKLLNYKRIHKNSRIK